MNLPDLSKITPEQYAATPVGFGRVILGFDFYPWQERVLWDLAFGDKPICLAAVNGSGKTSRVATTALLWHCAVFPKSQVVDTAGVFRQVKEQLWAGIKGLHHRLGTSWQVNETSLVAPNGSTAVGFSTDDPGKFEGYHGGDGGMLLLILDEAKSIPDSIFEASKRLGRGAKQKRVMIISSTGGSDGEFGAALTRKRHFYSVHKVTAADCPHIKPEETQQLIQEYGEGHALVKSMVYSELMDGDDSEYILSRSTLNYCLDNPPHKRSGERYAFIDWAAGGDECVIAIKDGNEVLPLICWRDQDTGRSVGRAVRELREARVEKGCVWADNGGLGIPMNQQMAELGFPVSKINNDAKANKNTLYNCRGAEIWHDTAHAVRKCQVLLPKDEKLFTQMTSRKTLVDSKGKLDLESKADMRKRGLSSPDRADAVCGVIALSGMGSLTGLNLHNSLTLGWQEPSLVEDDRYAGFFAG